MSKQGVEACYVNSYDLAIPVAFALGVDARWYEYASDGKKYTFTTLSQDSKLCTIRSLCVMRTLLLRVPGSFSANKSLQDSYKFPQFVTDTLKKSQPDVLHHFYSCWVDAVVDVSLRINAQLPALLQYLPLAEEHPDWFLDLFKMGETRDEIAKRAPAFSQRIIKSIAKYPQRVWVSLDNPDTLLLSNDYMLAFRVYRQHGACPNCQDYKRSQLESELTQTPEQVWDTDYVSELFSFLKRSARSRLVIAIDAQNIGAVTAVHLVNLVYSRIDSNRLTVKVYLDGRESDDWIHLSEMLACDVDVSVIAVARVNSRKSAVDTAIISDICKEYYSNRVRNFMLVSGDCDFMPMAVTLEKSNFCFCGRSSNTSLNAMNFSRSSNTTYILLDRLLQQLGVIRQKYTVGEVIGLISDMTIDMHSIVSQVADRAETLQLSLSWKECTAIVSQLLWGGSLFLKDGTSAGIKSNS